MSLELAPNNLAEYQRDGYTIVQGAYTADECDAFVYYMLDLHAGRIQIEGFAPRDPETGVD